MEYFVTGATGFIGKRLVRTLLQRPGAVVHFLVRPQSEARLPGLLAFWNASPGRAIPVVGDLESPKLGLPAEAVERLEGRIDHLFHLGAIYDLAADEASQVRVNVEGTRRVVEFAEAIGARHLHHVSSIAAAGLYEGVFREDMFEEAQNLDHPYFRTKHDSERIVRTESRVPWTVYRPAMVVGDSRTGEMDKVDGPYYLFKPIQRLRQILPPWVPMVGVEGGRLNLVPVDFVVAALDHIAHAGPRIDGRCFQLVDPRGYRVGEVLDILCRAAHAPRIGLFVNAGLLRLVPSGLTHGMTALEPVQRLRETLMKDLGLPRDILDFVNYPTRFDGRETLAALEGSGIECPNFKDYAWRLWDYWERHLDPDLSVDRSLRGAVAGKVVLVTGGSSGIGLASATRFAEAGAVTLLCARDESKLQDARRRILEQVGAHARVETFSADVADEDACRRLLAWVQATHGGVDVLVNSAGRSIRRAVESSYDRFHDFERTMRVNYFGALRVTLGVLPGMVARKRGHVVNISSIGVQTYPPRFSGYVASKAALDAWTRCAASEYADRGVTFTTIDMPLVRTPMTAPTDLYDNVPLLSPQEAASLVVQACIDKPVRIATRLGMAGEALNVVTPRLALALMNTAFRMFPESAASRGEPGRRSPLSQQAAALQQLMRGIHF